jgi:NADP-dependent 3-hydroxy acid dehydrogenase YdfG
MQKQKSGHIINIASVFGIKMFAPGGTVYCATKAAVRALTEGLRMELHSQSIRRRRSPSASVLSLTVDSQEGAGMRVCADEQDRGDHDRGGGS